MREDYNTHTHDKCTRHAIKLTAMKLFAQKKKKTKADFMLESGAAQRYTVVVGEVGSCLSACLVFLWLIFRFIIKNASYNIKTHPTHSIVAAAFPSFSVFSDMRCAVLLSSFRFFVVSLPRQFELNKKIKIQGVCD